ncbi:MAG: VanZ family protein [Candidatus Thiodiazotropha sp.]
MPISQNRKSIKRLLFRVLLLCALSAIGFLAFTPLQIPGVSSLNDKVSHLAAFLCLGLLTDFAWSEHRWRAEKYLSLLGYGLFIEVVQAFLPFRQFSLWDLVADSLGLMLYGFLLPYLLRINLFRDIRD